MRFTFISFATHSTHDRLFIYDGPTSSSPLISMQNVNYNPGVVTATNPTGQLTFTFISNVSGVAQGWEAQISCVGGGGGVTSHVMSSNSISACTGTWSDPGGVNPYADNLNITQTISPAATGTMASLSFSSFDTESGNDILYVYNGANTSAPLLGTYSGALPPFTITASNPAGLLTLHFISDGSGAAQGWQAQISCITPPSNDHFMSNNPETTCSGIWHDPGGVANYPNTIQPYAQTFTPAVSGSMLQFNFTSFETRQGVDILYISNGPNSSAPLIGAYSGNLNPFTVTASNPSGQLHFSFNTNTNIAGSAPGWQAEIACIGGPGGSPVYHMNPLPVTTCSGTFYDPGGTGPYANNQHITQTFTPATPGTMLRFDFSSFQTETCCDYLRIYNGPDISSPVIGYHLGTNSPGVVVASNPTGQLTFEFRSDGTDVDQGWVAEISCVAPSGIADNMANNKLNIFPNPTNGKLTINLQQAGPTATVIVLNMLGQQLMERKVQQTDTDLNLELNLTHFPKGLYIVQVNNANHVYSRKIVLE